MLIDELDWPSLFERSAVRSKEIGDAVNVSQALGRSRNNQKAAAGNDGSRREGIIDARPGDLVTTEVVEPRVGIVQLDKLEIISVSPGRWFVHDFRNDNRRFAAGRAQSFVAVIDGAHHQVRAGQAEISELGCSRPAGIMT